MDCAHTAKSEYATKKFKAWMSKPYAMYVYGCLLNFFWVNNGIATILKNTPEI